MPVGATNCLSCHNTSNWKPSSWNHTQVTVANSCTTCHSGSYLPAVGRPAAHIPYQTLGGVAIANCDTCHKGGTTSWTPSKFHANVSVSNQCATCHTGSNPPAVGKPNTAIHNGVTNCESCHKSTASWAGAKVDHSGFNAATNCASCHNGSAATGKSAKHVPVAATNCIGCHSTTGWTPTKWNHTQVTVTNSCATCHTGGFPPADGKSATHIPYQTLSGVSIANCDTCHKAGFAAWAPSKFHSNVSLSNQCSSCHLTGTYGLTSKPTTAIHSTVTGNCESCHKSTASWAGAKVDHSTYTVATNCSTCHNGSAATGKSAKHIPVAATNCISCHNTTGWTPTKWNHTQVTVTNQLCDLSQRFLPAGRREACKPHPVPDSDRRRHRQLRFLSQGRLRSLVAIEIPQQCVAEQPMLQLSFDWNLWANLQADHGDSQHGDGQLRELPQIDSQLGRRQGGSQHLHSGHQLLNVPQR